MSAWGALERVRENHAGGMAQKGCERFLTGYDFACKEAERIMQEQYGRGYDALVKIELVDSVGDKRVITELMTANNDRYSGDWTWLYDWWEGEPGVRVLGVLPLDFVEVPETAN